MPVCSPKTEIKPGKWKFINTCRQTLRTDANSPLRDSIFQVIAMEASMRITIPLNCGKMSCAFYSVVHKVC